MSLIQSSVLVPASVSETPGLRVTQPDMERLRALVERHLDGGFSGAAELLEWELERAAVVPQGEIPPDVVTMRSRVRVEDVETGRQREVSLVYPQEADVGETRLSVLAPVGVALLGARVGDIVELPLPRGRSSRLRIVEVIYQPEAAGDLHL